MAKPAAAETPAPKTYFLTDYKPEKGMQEITSCEVLAWKHIPVGSWIIGSFLRTEHRKAKQRETTVLVFKHQNESEFALGESSVLQSALLKAGAVRSETNPEQVDYNGIKGKVVAIQNLGQPAGQRYFNLKIFVRD